MGIKLKLNLQVEKVNRYPYRNLNTDRIFDFKLSIFFLHISITDIYQIIHTLNNPKTVKACFGGYIRNSLIILALNR
jgi:hypothetical protein